MDSAKNSSALGTYVIGARALSGSTGHMDMTCTFVCRRELTWDIKMLLGAWQRIRYCLWGEMILLFLWLLIPGCLIHNNFDSIMLFENSAIIYHCYQQMFRVVIM